MIWKPEILDIFGYILDMTVLTVLLSVLNYWERLALTYLGILILENIYLGVACLVLVVLVACLAYSTYLTIVHPAGLEPAGLHLLLLNLPLCQESTLVLLAYFTIPILVPPTVLHG